MTYKARFEHVRVPCDLNTKSASTFEALFCKLKMKTLHVTSKIRSFVIVLHCMMQRLFVSVQHFHHLRYASCGVGTRLHESMHAPLESLSWALLRRHLHLRGSGPVRS